MAVEEFIKVKIPHHHRYSYSADTGVNFCWKWTCDNFGPPGQTYNQGFRWQWDTNYTFFFRDEADAVLFALKWA